MPKYAVWCNSKTSLSDSKENEEETQAEDKMPIDSLAEEIMDKRPFKKHSIKEQDSAFREKYNILDEKYTKIKEILKQVLAELRELKLEKQRLTAEQEKLVAEIKEKDDLLERMQSVSEAVIDEYTALKLKCDLETEAANNAIKRATKYFQENQKLKRNTGRESESDIAGEDTNEIRSEESLLDENTSELDVLNNLASELRTEIANLKIQLSKEIEKQNSLKEDFEIAKKLYEQEMKDHNCTKEKLQSLQLIHSNSRLEDIDSENYHSRNSFQSNEVEDYNTTKCISEKHDVENYDNLTAKLESAEVQVANYKQENGKLQCKIQELESQIRKLNKEVSASDLLPIPPPPPPPPLPPPSFNPIKSLITFIHAGKKSAKTVKKENSENPQQKAMSEMIDAIKKGNIQLKPTPKTVPLSPKKEVEETALGEMKNILASLKKKNSPCEDTKPAELPNVHERRSVDFSNQETDENFNMGSDIDDELKSLLRKQSIKITTNKVINDDDDEIGKDFEIPSQEAATSDENQFVSNDFPDNSRLCSENEKNLEISAQESVVSNENWFADSVLSDKSRMSPESEKSPEIPLQDSATSDKNNLADNFLSNNSKMSMENETSLEIALKKSISENQLADSVSSNCKMTTENEKCLEIPLPESTTADKNKLADNFLSNNSKRSMEKETSLEIALKKSTTENQLAKSVSSDCKMGTENEKSHEISLLESATENQLADNVFSLNSRMSTENEKSLEIPLQESITGDRLLDHLFSDDNKKSAENERNLGIPLQESANENFSDYSTKNTENDKSLKIPLQESTTENQLADHLFPDSRKSVENEKSVGVPLQESVKENQPADNVFSDDSRKSAENEKSVEISSQESTTSGEMQLADSFLSDNSRLSSENETIII
ncbi:hypothetical protein AVEN_198190-2 [Araneus ventricosus]|uniref:WH2 domain-containing protein n=1 Tax=Araneus ventricosus TaxID=182803 RepID=A0A4Y2E7X1_ARAVE|nr:hypothetical protein AVEN_198190-2 [Araneus ventricosus]